MILRADEHYNVVRQEGGARHGQVRFLRCKSCEFSVNVIALHHSGDKSGAGRYYRARARMVKHWHTAHRPDATQPSPINYVVDEATGCWVWQRCKNDKGYGQTEFRGKLWLAHRAAWTGTYGDIPDGLNILHRCDNRACVNPQHLFLGTQADNIADCIAKGRKKVGGAHGRAKLTDNQVREIRGTDWAGLTRRAVATRYGVSQATISRILLGTHWKHVQC